MWKSSRKHCKICLGSSSCSYRDHKLHWSKKIRVTWAGNMAGCQEVWKQELEHPQELWLFASFSPSLTSSFSPSLSFSLFPDHFMGFAPWPLTNVVFQGLPNLYVLSSNGHMKWASESQLHILRGENLIGSFWIRVSFKVRSSIATHGERRECRMDMANEWAPVVQWCPQIRRVWAGRVPVKSSTMTSLYQVPYNPYPLPPCSIFREPSCFALIRGICQT